MEVSGYLRISAALPSGKNPGNRRIRGWMGLSWRFQEEENLLLLPKFDARTVYPAAQSTLLRLAIAKIDCYLQ